MALPVPHDVCVTPVYTYTGGMHPYIPPVTPGPNSAAYVTTLATICANEAGQKSQFNALRRFAYNMFSSNNWNNPYFKDLVQLACDLVDHSIYTRKAVSPDSTLHEAATRATTLLSSSYAFLYPELKSHCDPRTVDAAMQNQGFLNKFKTEIAQMYNQGQGGHPHPGHMTPQPVHAPQPVHHQPQPMHPAPQPAMIQMFDAYGRPYFVPANQGAPMVMGGTNYPHQPQPQYHPPQHHMHGGGHGGGPGSIFGRGVPMSAVVNEESTVARDIRQSRFFTRGATEPVREPEPIQQAQEPVKELETVPVLEIIGGHEMDRSQHQITYLGNSYTSQTLERASHLRTAVEENVERASEENLFSVYSKLTIEPTLDMAILNGQILRLSKFSDSGAFRIFSDISNPIIGRADLREYMNRIRSAANLKDVAFKIRSLGASMDALKTKEELGNSVHAEEYVSILNWIDRKLTTYVNEYLRYGLDLHIEIQSFVEDIGDIDRHLQQNYGPTYSSEFAHFSKELHTHLTKNELNDEIRGSLLEWFDLDGLSAEFIPERVSITYVQLNDKELGYVVGEEAAIIPADRAPTLYSICLSLQQHKKEKQYHTLADYLVTGDGVRYRLHRRVIGGSGVFLISKR